MVGGYERKLSAEGINMTMALGRPVRVVKSRAVVAGSGCAGLNCADCPADMARDLCSTGMHGDEAYVEAANSAACFLKPARLGVPFPTNRMGNM